MRSNRGAHPIDMWAKWKHVVLLAWVVIVHTAYYGQFWHSLDSVIGTIRHVLGLGS